MQMPEGRPSPEQLLKQIEHEEQKNRRGRLKVFLGYASGVGKSASMFEEGIRRRARGEDVVVGAVQTKSSAGIQQLLLKHEIIPTQNVEDRAVIDLPAILSRRPQVVLIDGLAYENPPGSAHAYRWQDVATLIDAGISVITSVNLQYVAELQDEIAAITGKRMSDTVPKSFLEQANEIVIADVPAGESLGRIGGGADEERRLSRLREMAMLLAAEVVELQLQSYLHSHGIEEVWGTQERILVCITPRSNARQVLESGKRNADRFHGELFAVYVRQPKLSAEDQAALEKNLDIAREIGASVEMLEGRDSVEGLIQFAKERGVTQIFIGHSKRRGWWDQLRGNPVERLIDSAEGIDVRVFPQEPSQ
jgi:two-component system, OmpR family, sensor histidine kinase KdpD